MSLGIAKHTGLMYEARGGSYLPLISTPLLSHARVVDLQDPSRNRVPDQFRFEGQQGLIFREDSFDPVARTRRGRLYEGGRHSQPSIGLYALPHPCEIPNAAPTKLMGAQTELFVYVPPSDFIVQPATLLRAVLGLGTSSFETRWRVIGLELVGYGDLLLTLKSLSAFGILPELRQDTIHVRARAEVMDAVNQLVSAAFRETAGSVIDQCRHALVTIIASELHEHGEDKKIFEKDLTDLCKVLWRHGKRMLAASAWTVARLHNKTKPNSRVQHGLSRPVEEDASYCIHVVGLVLGELGWAN